MVFKIDYAGAVFGGKWEYYARYDENERGGAVSKKVYIIYKIRSIRGFKSTDSK